MTKPKGKATPCRCSLRLFRVRKGFRYIPSRFSGFSGLRIIKVLFLTGDKDVKVPRRVFLRLIEVHIDAIAAFFGGRPGDLPFKLGGVVKGTLNQGIYGVDVDVPVDDKVKSGTATHRPEIYYFVLPEFVVP